MSEPSHAGVQIAGDELALPTGLQFELRQASGGRTVRAVVTELGAMLRVLEVDGVPLIEGFDETVYPTYCAGWVLIPWPNRVRDGRWSYDGRERQFPLTESERGNALHGLLFSLPHEVVAQSSSAVTLRARSEPSDAYPFALTVDTTYALADGAAGGAGAAAGARATAAGVLLVTHSIANTGERQAPVAVGSHPYFRVGDVPTNELTVTLRASTRVSVDDRLNPVGSAPVAGTRFDLNEGALVGDLDLDTAYFDLEASADGTYRHSIAAPDGRRIEVWGDANYKHAQVFTTQIFPTGGGLGWAVAVEPTTAPPDALNSGVDLRWIAPGETWASSWGIDFVTPDPQGENA
ncbi:aldose 1-epimerase family protein [Subtercola lobariae]|uniref:Aldose 1-epimerase n=1 Tax=Subtercola lobariae TaxID=1588641 RepID=A0A917B8T2_9MICO|nr:aldose 1-epimerase family protein [Subtercola lobariae]GGF29294.1 aldose 1-epimerase [Subtercola lobariae]